MTELTPRDDIKKKVSEILKRVDHLIRAGEVDQAMREIIHAKETDPKNVYIFAYEERITYLKEEHEKHRQQEQTRKAAEEAARIRDAEAQLKAEEARRSREAARQQAVVREVQAPRPQPPASPPARSVEELERELHELEADVRRKEEEERRLLVNAPSTPERLERYQNELARAWDDGALTPLEEEQLKELRMELSIGIQEHMRLSKQAQFNACVKAFRQAWSSGTITPERFSELSDIRKRFQISPEDSDRLEAEILSETRSGLQPATLVVIDDDIKLLNLVSDILREASYSVLTFSTSDDAYTYLKKNSPDMIISDINLETSTMGGFTFYEKVREMDHLQNVPFIFLSGLTDEVLIRTGKELGVDDYLTKPFSDETLLATIKGKLKRFRKLSQTAKKK
ncbi:MAG: Response regulatory protein [Bacteroidetes bacterium]|nr:Response regulatory protein [Bacteroidota bacterium]